MLSGAASRFHVSLETDAGRIAECLPEPELAGNATAFQSAIFLKSWYRTIGPALGEPLLATVTHRSTGSVAAILPLVRRRTAGLRVVEFADGGVSDYNFPVLGPAAPTTPAEAKELWAALRSALSKDDVIRLTKMPHRVEADVNPFGLVSPLLSCAVRGNSVVIDDWSTYLRSLERMFRKELRRSWRLFERHQGAAFRQITDPVEIDRVMTAIEQHQRARFAGRGCRYLLDQPHITNFYRTLAADGIAADSVVLTALMQGEEIVSALLGLKHNKSFVMVRLSSGDREWAHCSPGRLVIVRTMQMLQSQGFRHFDFSIGDQAYKRRLGAKPSPLFAFTGALSSRGWPLVAYDRAKDTIRRHQSIDRFARRILGKDRSHSEGNAS